MERYNEINQETMQILVDTLIQRTQNGTISWHNLQYGSILFLRGPRDEDESEPEILQTFKLTTDFNGVNCELEIHETISLPSGKGNIYVSINYIMGGEGKDYELALSHDFDKYNECSAESLKNVYEDSSIVKLADVIANLFDGFDTVEYGFSCASYFMEIDIEPVWKRNLIVKLGRHLLNEKRMMDFHRIILDTDYRHLLESGYKRRQEIRRKK